MVQRDSPIIQDSRNDFFVFLLVQTDDQPAVHTPSLSSGAPSQEASYRLSGLLSRSNGSHDGSRSGHTFASGKNSWQ